MEGHIPKGCCYRGTQPYKHEFIHILITPLREVDGCSSSYGVEVTKAATSHKCVKVGQKGRAVRTGIAHLLSLLLQLRSPQVELPSHGIVSLLDILVDCVRTQHPSSGHGGTSSSYSFFPLVAPLTIQKSACAKHTNSMSIAHSDHQFTKFAVRHQQMDEMTP